MSDLSRATFFEIISGKTQPVSPDRNPYANTSTPVFSSRAITGLDPFSGTFDQDALIHLLRRSLFGVRKEHLSFFSGFSLDQALSQLLTPSPLPAPPVNTYNNASFTDPDVLFGETWVNAPYGAPGSNVNGKRRNSFKQWSAGTLLNQSLSLSEKMYLFLHNFIATQTSGIGDSRYIYKHHALLKSYALGNYKSLILAVTKDPGMLVYLNGNTNSNLAPNENYGRELQELFTVGRGEDSLYTEDDVIAASRVLTGWRENPLTITSFFNPNKHDTGPKQFSAFYNNTLISGQSGANGALETDQLIDMIFAQQETARFLARKLYRFFVYYVIDEQVETDIIAPLADIIVQNNYELIPALSALLGSEHFFDPLNRGCYIKTPVDHLIGVCRQFNVSFPDASNLDDQYKGWGTLASSLSLLTMDIGDPPNVAGWPAYNEDPQFHELWINSNTLPGRNQFTDAISSQNGLTMNGVNLKIDFLQFVSQLNDPSDPNLLIAEIAFLLSPNPIGDSLTTFLKSILLSGQSSDYYWTNAWLDYVSDPSQVNVQAVESRLRSMFTFLLDMAEYQLV